MFVKVFPFRNGQTVSTRIIFSGGSVEIEVMNTVLVAITRFVPAIGASSTAVVTGKFAATNSSTAGERSGAHVTLRVSSTRSMARALAANESAALCAEFVQ